MDGGRFPWHEFTGLGIDVPTLVVDTTEGYDPPLESIIAFLGQTARSL